VTALEAPGRQAYTAPLGAGWRVFTLWRGPPANRNVVAGELTTARARKLHFDLYGAATASVDIEGVSPETATIAELSQDLMVWRFRTVDGGYDTLFRGVIGHSEDTLDGTTHTTNVQAADYRAMIGRSIVPAQAFTAAPEDSIVDAITSTLQQNASYPQNLGINYMGPTNPDGSAYTGAALTARTITYNGTEQVGAEIDKLATMQGGFEWGCEPYFSPPMTPASATASLYLWYPSRGVTKPFVAEYGVNVTTVKRTLDSTGFANWVQYTGASGTAAQVASGDVVANPQLHPEGLWTETKSDSNETDTAHLLAEAQHDLGFDSNLTPTYTLALAPGAWGSKTDCWLGDTIEVRVTSGRLAVDINVRVVQIDFAIDDNGNETVSLVVARPPLTLAGVLDVQTQNLYQLNRR
jgi:hypothetical protein